VKCDNNLALVPLNDSGHVIEITPFDVKDGVPCYAVGLNLKAAVWLAVLRIGDSVEVKGTWADYQVRECRGEIIDVNDDAVIARIPAQFVTRATDES
jgi:hypothetical protein